VLNVAPLFQYVKDAKADCQDHLTTDH
jgi:hypothetical protein